MEILKTGFNTNLYSTQKTAKANKVLLLNQKQDSLSFKGAIKKQDWAPDTSTQTQKDILKALEDVTANKYLAHGADGNVYLLKNISGFPNGLVVKVSHTKPVDSDGRMQRVGKDFNDEKSILSELPDSLSNTQRMVGFISKGDEENYLVTTFVEGKKANPSSNPLKPAHLSSLLDSLFKLDEAGILHRDLKNDNWFITQDGKANLLDYGCSIKVDLSDVEKNSNEYHFPSFSVPSNIRSFEDTGLFPYLKELAKAKGSHETRELFIDYLKLRSEFHEKRADMLEQMVKDGHKELKDAQKYEALQAKLFKNPSDELVDLEATKIQMTSSAEDAYRNEVLEKNPLANITLKFFSLINAKKFDLKIKEMEKRPLSSEMKEYLKFEEKLFNYRAKDKLSEWTKGLINWVFMNITGEHTQLHPEFLNKNITKFEIPDVASEIIEGNTKEADQELVNVA